MKFLFFFISFFTLLACSNQTVKENEDDDWQMPENEFPSVFKSHLSYELAVYTAEIIPDSLEFGCTKRNDSPHLWCIIEAKLKKPNPKFPQAIIAAYMSSQPKVITETHQKLIHQLRKSKSPVFLTVTMSRTGISQIEGTNAFSSAYFSIHNAKYCQNWYNYFNDCPKNSKHIEL